MIRKAMRYITDPERDIRERLFLLVTSLALFGVLLTILTGILEGEDYREIIILSLALFIGTGCMIIAIRHHAVKICALIQSVALVFLILPGCFFFGGGTYGGVVVWFAFGFLYIGMILDGAARIIMISLLTLTIILEYLAEYYRLITVIPHSFRLFFSDSLVAVVLVGMVIYIMMLFQQKYKK